MNSAATTYANNASSLVSQWAGLYGSDSAWLLEHPPAAPPVPANPYNGTNQTASQLEAGAAPYLAWQASSAIPPPARRISMRWRETA